MITLLGLPILIVTAWVVFALFRYRKETLNHQEILLAQLERVDKFSISNSKATLVEGRPAGIPIPANTPQGTFFYVGMFEEEQRFEKQKYEPYKPYTMYKL